MEFRAAAGTEFAGVDCIVCQHGIVCSEPIAYQIEVETEAPDRTDVTVAHWRCHQELERARARTLREAAVMGTYYGAMPELATALRRCANEIELRAETAA